MGDSKQNNLKNLTKLIEAITAKKNTVKNNTPSQSEQVIRKKSLIFLSIREHSSFELNRKLLKAGFISDAIEVEIEALKNENYLSDERFCEMYIRAKKLAGFGPIKISFNLKQHQLSSTLIESFLEPNSEKWHKQAEMVRLQKFGKNKPTGWHKKAKQMRFLQSRGFNNSQINSAMKF